VHPQLESTGLVIGTDNERRRIGSDQTAGVASATIPRPGVRDHLGLARLAQRDLGGLLDTIYERWGPVVDVGYRSLRIIFLFGPEPNRLILHERPDNFLWGQALSVLVPVDGPTALVVTDGDDHDRRRRLVQPAFSLRRVNAHAELIVDEADRLLDTWTRGETASCTAYSAAIRSALGPARERDVVGGNGRRTDGRARLSACLHPTVMGRPPVGVKLAAAADLGSVVSTVQRTRWARRTAKS